MLTLLTQVFGVRGFYGDLLLSPKLTSNYFERERQVSVHTQFADKRILVTYKNPKKIPCEHTCISQVTINGKELKNLKLNEKDVLIPRLVFLRNVRKAHNTIVVTLE